MKAMARSGLRLGTGLGLGAVAAIAELVFVLLSALALLFVQAWPGPRRVVQGQVGRLARRLAEAHRRRLDTYLDVQCSPAYPDAQALAYVATRWPLGILGAVVLLSVILGAGYGSLVFVGWFIPGVQYPVTLLLTGCAGLFLLFLAVQGVLGVATLERKLARRFLGPSRQEELKRRIEELAVSRAGVVEAVHDERRRIERDLHDGVQQRLVALGMLLGRAVRGQDPDRSAELLRQAHEESRHALTELREVAWRIYPTVLDEAGLRAALETVVERSTIEVSLTYEIANEPRRPVATVAYFVVSEAVTNALKHSEASRIRVEVREVEVAAGESRCVVRIEDNGTGGADPDGSGLIGLAQRLAALDGRLAVNSPEGGPTIITAELPCV
ncbi:histidine kinase [Streptomyces sp. YIM 130001]|uniref:sensor histidine kinase n=1 Tax=Streptomyces sp. YIM 130001 TaxID=2259644 RepID=UPI000E65B067|nr:histidine kinase [Streptomyces sp. YIM 130001]